MTTSSVTLLLKTFPSVIIFPWTLRRWRLSGSSFPLLYRHCFRAQLDPTRDTHFLLFVIVNTAAFFALDAHHCNNTTGSRGKEALVWSRKSLRSPIPHFTFDFGRFSCHVFTRMVFRLGWAHQPLWIFIFLSSWDYCYDLRCLRLGHSLQEISSGRPRGQNLVYPIALHYFYHHLAILSALATLQHSCQSVTVDVLFLIMMPGSRAASACVCMAPRHMRTPCHL